MRPFIILFFMSQLNAVSIDSPCITDVRVENIKFIGQKGIVGSKSEIIRSCYDTIPNKNKNVLAFSTHTSCYVPLPSFLQTFQGKSFARCGTCLQISGPSLKRAVCTIVGATKMQTNSTDEMISYLKTIFVDEEMFKYLSGFHENYGDGVALPIVAQVINCPYKTAPSAVVKSIKEENEKYFTELVLFNTNLIVDKVEFDGKFYFLNSSTCLYNLLIPKSTTSGTLKLYNFAGEAIALPFKLELNSIQTATNSLNGNLKETTCFLRLEPNISNTTAIPDSHFSWKLYVRDTLDPTKLTLVDLSNPVIEFDNEVYLSLVYPYPIKISQHYSYFYTDFTIDTPIVKDPDFETYAFVDSIENSVETKCLKDFVLNRHVSVENGKYRIQSQLSMKIAKCYAQLNHFVVHYVTNKHSILKFNELYLQPINELNFTKCAVGLFRCTLEDECNPTNSTIEPEDGTPVKNYTEGCTPFCGQCKIGYTCNKAAKCVKVISLNQRNESKSLVVLQLLFIITILLLF